MNVGNKNNNKKTIAAIFSIVAFSATLLGTAEANNGLKKGQNKVEICHMQDDGDHKILTIPLNAALNHIEHHEDDFFSVVEGECVRAGVSCPLTADETSTILMTFELSSVEEFIDYIDVDKSTSCRFRNVVQSGTSTLLFVSTVKETNLRLGLSNSFVDGNILGKRGAGEEGFSNDEIRACAAMFGCKTFPTDIVNP